MEIRKATLEDYDLIYDLAQRTWYNTYTKILSLEQLEYMLDMMYSREAIAGQMDAKGHQFLLIADEGMAIGFASYELNYKPDTAKLHKLYVLPNIQGKGAGRLLMHEVEKAALVTAYEFSGIIKPRTAQEHYGLSYESFVVPLVKAVQEQQQIIIELKSQVDKLQKTVQALEKKVT